MQNLRRVHGEHRGMLEVKGKWIDALIKDQLEQDEDGRLTPRRYTLCVWPSNDDS